MIFRPELARLIVRGRKTATRRPAREERCRYRPSHSYAVQPGRGRIAIARIVIATVTREPLGAIDFAAAQAEGFRTTADFAHYWRLLYDRRYTEDDRPDDDEQLLQEWRADYGDTPVWAITFSLDTSHQPRLLGPSSRLPSSGDPSSDDAHGYIDDPRRALPDEPEAIDDHLLDYYTRDAHERFAGTPGRREEALRRRARSIANRLRQEAVAADRSGLDITAELDQIEQHLAVLERRRRAA